MAGSVLNEDYDFSVTWDVGFGNSVYVAGSCDELGNWDPVQAVKLRYTGENVWVGSVAVPNDRAVEYRFLYRDDDKADHCAGTNVTWDSVGNVSATTAPPPSAPYSGKTAFYYSSWTNAFLLEVVSTGGVSHVMTPVGPGRVLGESLFRVDGVGEAGHALEFVMHDGIGNFDNAPYPGFGSGANNYYTPLDVFWLQDGDVFNYEPHTNPAPAQVVNGFVNSTATNIPGRDIRVYLPRGYNEHTNRYYPVLYMHDGQNVFDPGGAFGSWSVDATATKEISQGRIRECIIVGINNNANRLNEYLPPTDEITPGTPGIGDKYVDFLEDNVRPYINALYRTRTEREETFAMGSSMGGLISLYMGVERTGWGRIGVLSPAFWRGVNYYAQLQSLGTEGLDRVYLDWGTLEGEFQNDEPWDEWYGIYDVLLSDGYTQRGDLRLVIGCGDAHNEPAWARRLPEAFRYLLNIQEELNMLTLQHHAPPLELEIEAGDTADAEISFPTLAGMQYTLYRGDSPNPSTEELSFAETHFPWNVREHADSGDSMRVYRVEGRY